MAQSPYPIRLPGNLRSLLEIEAAKHGQSLASYIVGACWAQLERHGGDGRVMIEPNTVAPELTAAGLEVAGVDPKPVCVACEGSMVEGRGKSTGLWACQDKSCPRYCIGVRR